MTLVNNDNVIELLNGHNVIGSFKTSPRLCLYDYTCVYSVSSKLQCIEDISPNNYSHCYFITKETVKYSWS